MMIRAPFVRWTVEDHLTRMHGVQPSYLLLATDGEKKVAAISYAGENDNVIYRPDDRFVHDYAECLRLHANLQWTSEAALRVWLSAVVYNSFVYCSTLGVGSSWYLAVVTDDNLTGLMGCSRYVQGHNKTVWIVLRHGSKSWPVRVVDNIMQYGWGDFCAVHRLANGYKVIMSCERKWIFNTIIFDPNDNEVVYDWSEELNPYWQHIEPAEDDLHTACFPSVFNGQSTLMTFGYTCGTTMFNGKEFVRRLYPMVMKLNLDEVTIKMGNRSWTIPSNRMCITYPIFREFIEDLHLKWTDFILVAVLDNCDIRVVVIDGIENSEKNYAWV